MIGPYIVCPRCGTVSHHPMDITERYCGVCHQYHDDGEIDRQLAIEHARREEWREVVGAMRDEWWRAVQQRTTKRNK
jgi:hypothetical protein